MGEVISISRVSDVDIFKEFEDQCPAIPADVDAGIPRSAQKSVGRRSADADQTLFRRHCGIVVALSLGILILVKFVSATIASDLAGESDLQLRDIERDAVSHRQTQETWQAYIEQLEQDPFYQRVVQEKALYQQRYAN